ncbi:putative Dynein-light chain-protein [Leptomonas pyrrhocoris]|uniref:Putative Dynein-light chain-protein n=1 Tax=Leptomonas pyrrhocoris TaxID=157538 RepID=A0A0N0DUH6_LEPPY|nr:putative Dynein-light chain-protein [Leptomonas pyrrhocoris]KPA78554.1 putative Dynein-light chain-protein [Leptomonas pyrrhocoris]|eukprot:XP_015656993.1 putative Dynein-light chain-protein [Leptomonas pyrrhocoris]
MSDQHVEDAAATSTSNTSISLLGLVVASGSNNSALPPSPAADTVKNGKTELAPVDAVSSGAAASAAGGESSITNDVDAVHEEVAVGAASSHLEDSDVAKSGAEHDDEEEDAAELDTVAANDVKNIILQVLSPYFDDDVSATSDVGGGGGAGEGMGVGGNAGPGPSGPPNTGGKAGTGAPPPTAAPHEHEEEISEDVAQRYDHVKSEMWIARICDGIMERLVGLGKPFKFVVHAMVMRKCGAGLHVCSSCYYAPSDGWLSHSHDLSAHLYAVVTVYWCAT